MRERREQRAGRGRRSPPRPDARMFCARVCKGRGAARAAPRDGARATQHPGKRRTTPPASPARARRRQRTVNLAARLRHARRLPICHCSRRRGAHPTFARPPAASDVHTPPQNNNTHHPAARALEGRRAAAAGPARMARRPHTPHTTHAARAPARGALHGAAPLPARPPPPGAPQLLCCPSLACLMVLRRAKVCVMRKQC